MIYFAADLHLGHKNICLFQQEFKTVREHDEFVLDSISDALRHKRTLIYLLGDVAFTQSSILELAKLQGKVHGQDRIKIVLGNHDVERGPTITDWVNAGFTDIHGLLRYKEFWLSHAPIHPDELRGKFNIYGHTHYSYIDDPRYRCVSLEQIKYRPISLEEIRAEFTRFKELKHDYQT